MSELKPATQTDLLRPRVFASFDVCRQELLDLARQAQTGPCGPACAHLLQDAQRWGYLPATSSLAVNAPDDTKQVHALACALSQVIGADLLRAAGKDSIPAEQTPNALAGVWGASPQLADKVGSVQRSGMQASLEAQLALRASHDNPQLSQELYQDFANRITQPDTARAREEANALFMTLCSYQAGPAFPSESLHALTKQAVEHASEGTATFLVELPPGLRQDNGLTARLDAGAFARTLTDMQEHTLLHKQSLESWNCLNERTPNSPEMPHNMLLTAAQLSRQEGSPSQRKLARALQTCALDSLQAQAHKWEASSDNTFSMMTQHPLAESAPADPLAARSPGNAPRP